MTSKQKKTKRKFKLRPKQAAAYVYLTSPKYWDIPHVAYGGARYGGKSILGSSWLLEQCKTHPNVRYAAAAYDIEKSLNSQLPAVKETCRMMGLKEGVDWTFNKKERRFTMLSTGSEIIFFGLPSKSSDPNADWLAGYTFTGAWVDESNLIDRKVLYKFFESCGRVNNAIFVPSEDMTDDEKATYPTHVQHGGFKRTMIPNKILETFNPSHEHIFDRFWVPYRDNCEERTVFIRANVYDNLEPGDPYIKTLENIEDPVQRARMLMGSFEYNDSPKALFENDHIAKVFTNDASGDILSAVIDVAYVGKDIDKTTIGLFKGLDLYEVLDVDAKYTEDYIERLSSIIKENDIPMENVVVDANGPGTYIAGSKKFAGCKSFMGQETALRQRSGVTNTFRKDANRLETKMVRMFENIKAQCTVELASKFSSGDISISIQNKELHHELKQELLMYENLSYGTDRPIKVTGKAKFRKRIGRSPDHSDLLVMRMYLELLDGGIKKARPLKDRKFINKKVIVSNYV